ncbi:alkene reductase [Undibacterium sp. Ji50W]|uniref:alkene reductase n=1 Tax=Undibacterium sp. Ji50W TaxID=3413041 RepID=UPI003BEFB2AC
MTTSVLQQGFTKNQLSFKNRIFMAPMTRSRAVEQKPNDMMLEYYVQRASAGLIFTEAAQISPQGVGYIFTPGIHTQEQVQGWTKITQAVHAKGGKIYLQLWHVGRVSHPEFHGGSLPVAPSAIAFQGQAYTPSGPKDVVTPRALETHEVKAIIADYKNSAKLAKEAGFDGVEIHAANGYLPAQFLEDGSNQRTDEYGGSLENRSRFLVEVTKAVSDVWGPERVSVRLSPRNPYNGMSDSNPEATYLHVVRELEKLKLGMLHFMELATLPEGVQPFSPKVREIFSGMLILNYGYDQKSAEEVVSKGLADAVSFASLFIPNPDLPERFRDGHALATPDHATMYGGTAKGYIDYPQAGEQQ